MAKGKDRRSEGTDRQLQILIEATTVKKKIPQKDYDYESVSERLEAILYHFQTV
jgi:hypothetical protein